MDKEAIRDRVLFIALMTVIVGANIALFIAGRLEWNWTGIGIMVAATITISMYSFLYKDNVLFKLVEHLYIGVAAGYVTSVYWFNIFWPELIKPLFFPDPGEPVRWLRLVPLVLGITLLMRVSTRFGGLSRISFAFVMGFYSGIAIPNYIQTYMIEQIHYTINPLFVSGDTTFLILEALFLVSVIFYLLIDWLWLSDLNKPWANLLALIPAIVLCFIGIFSPIPGINQIVVLVGTLTVLIYFFFSIEQEGAVGTASKMGIYFLMISFGASFGYTIMARMSLLVGRLEFLLRDWLGILQ